MFSHRSSQLHPPESMKKQFGFSLIELLIVFVILALLSGIGFAALVDYSHTQTLKTAARDLRTNLRITQNKALTAEVPTGCANLNSYQLTFTSSTNYQIQPVCGGIPQTAVAQFKLPEGVTKTAGSDPVPFKVLTGGVDAEETITLGGFGKSEPITITTSGVIK